MDAKLSQRRMRTATPNNGVVTVPAVDGGVVEGSIKSRAECIPTDSVRKVSLVRPSSTTGVIPLQRPDGKEKEQAGLCLLSSTQDQFNLAEHH